MDEEPEPRAPAPERIDHTYCDYSRVELTANEDMAGDEAPRSRLPSNFPAKLHAIVSDPKNRDVIRWQVRRRDSCVRRYFGSLPADKMPRAATRDERPQPHGRTWKIVVSMSS